MKRWIVILVTLFVAGAAQARCPSTYATDCDYGSTCYNAVRACEEYEEKAEKAKRELRGAQTKIRKLRECLRPDPYKRSGYTTPFCARMGL